ncbi:HD domain-containing phosphohydrolase [Methyloterricola oryzae]|uniref:HD domain-containing phosphohydrolase n=1 Tax=Methyloterricola oryzae TaxID=1495050 RepID=UPI0005EAF002|nr:HD domain-containing phosphohydrolase [Methyloterricola oryzae]
METETKESDSRSEHLDTLLLVDDEASVLKSLTRLFRPHGYRILSAPSGQDGLTLLERESVDLVISDMRMPNMSGAEFLGKVRQNYPEIVRILLTGYADMESTIEAINQGQIYQYITKPWEEHDILLVVRHALDQKKLEREKRRLEQLTRQQNEELKALNASLDRKVIARTEELRQTVTFLELAQDQLQKGFMATVKTFASLLELREKELAGHARRVAEDARNIAEALDCSKPVIRDIIFASLLHDIGNIGLPSPLLNRPFPTMTADEKQEFMKHPQRGAAVLMGLEQFQAAMPLISAHHEHYDGGGFPKGIKGDEIPLGARIICVANEYDGLLSGKLLNRKYDPQAALTYMQEHKGKRYDPAVVDAFVAVKKGAALSGLDEKPETTSAKTMTAIRPARLEPGMVLARHLVTPGGFLLMPKGQKLTEFQIEHLISLEKTEDIKLNVYVRLDAADAEQGA